jgi:hypothetical protein
MVCVQGLDCALAGVDIREEQPDRSKTETLGHIANSVRPAFARKGRFDEFAATLARGFAPLIKFMESRSSASGRSRK